MSKQDYPDNDGLPTYDDATAGPSGQVLLGSGIVSEVEFRRHQLVQSAIDYHILPVLRRQAKYGLACSVTVIEPYEPPAFGFEKSGLGDEDKANNGEIVSPSDENLTIVQLEGDQNSREFWNQLSVIQELKQQLRNVLCASTVFEGVEFREPKPREPAEPAESSKGWRAWGKKSAVVSQVALAHPAKNSKGVQLSVEREDIVRRTENDFGLYETVTRPGIVVRVAVEC